MKEFIKRTWGISCNISQEADNFTKKHVKNQMVQNIESLFTKVSLSFVLFLFSILFIFSVGLIYIISLPFRIYSKYKTKPSAKGKFYASNKPEIWW